MRHDYFKEIEIPEGVEVMIEGNVLNVKGPEGENTKEFSLRKVNLDKKDNKVVVGREKSTKREKKVTNSVAAHISNMIKGVQEKFEYNLKICSSHFPMTVSLQEER